MSEDKIKKKKSMFTLVMPGFSNVDSIRCLELSF